MDDTTPFVLDDTTPADFESLDLIFSTLEYALTVFNFCTGLVATGLNSFVVYALLISQAGHETHGGDMFVIGLAIAELLTALSLVSSVIDIFVVHYRFHCIIQICFFQSSMLCSSLFVTLMTSDRCFKIVFPFLYQRICSVDAFPLTIASSIFVIAFFIGFLPLMGQGLSNHVNDSDWRLCSYLRVLHEGFRIPYYLLMSLPIVTAVSVYSKIFLVASVHIKNIAQTQRVVMKIPRVRYLKMIFVMAGLYSFFYIPPVAVSIVYDYSSTLDSDPLQMKAVFHLSSIGIISNTIVHPVIYAYNLPSLQNIFRRAMGLPQEVATRVMSTKSVMISESGHYSYTKKKRHQKKIGNSGSGMSSKGNEKSMDKQSASGHDKSMDKQSASGHDKSMDKQAGSGHEKSMNKEVASGHKRRNKLKKTLQRGQQTTKSSLLVTGFESSASNRGDSAASYINTQMRSTTSGSFCKDRRQGSHTGRQSSDSNHHLKVKTHSVLKTCIKSEISHSRSISRTLDTCPSNTAERRSLAKKSSNQLEEQTEWEGVLPARSTEMRVSQSGAGSCSKSSGPCSVHDPASELGSWLAECPGRSGTSLGQDSSLCRQQFGGMHVRFKTKERDSTKSSETDMMNITENTESTNSISRLGLQRHDSVYRSSSSSSPSVVGRVTGTGTTQGPDKKGKEEKLEKTDKSKKSTK